MNPPRPRLEGVARDHFNFRHPEYWANWPYLPVVRHRPDGEADLGVLYDFAHTSGRTGILLHGLRRQPLPLGPNGGGAAGAAPRGVRHLGGGHRRRLGH